MNYSLSVLIILSVVSFVKFTTLLFKKSGNRQANLFLAAFFFIISVYAFQGFAIESGMLEIIKWFYGWPLPIYALIHVTIFFYYIITIEDRLVWKPVYLLFFVPFILALIDVYFFYAKPSSEISAIINEAILYPDDRFEKEYGLFTLKSHFLFRYAWLLLAIVYLWFKLIPFIKNKTASRMKMQTNRWAFSFLLILSIICLTSIILIFVKCYPTTLNLVGPYFNSIVAIMFCATFLLAILPFYFPVTFYSYPKTTYNTTLFTKNTQPTEDDLEEGNLEDKIKFGLDIDSFKKTLLDLEKQKPYLSPDFDINAMAAHLEIPVHHLSYLLNKHCGLSFASYRNNLRMEHAAKLIEKGFLIVNTIEALTQECGFSSRSAFSKTFKSIIGENPSDYSLRFQMAVSSM